MLTRACCAALRRGGRAQNGMTPLYAAVDNNKVEVVPLLLARGADVGAKRIVRGPARGAAAAALRLSSFLASLELRS